MKLLFDAFELTPNSKKSRGIYNYSISLCRALAQRLPADDEMVISCNGDIMEDLKSFDFPSNVTLICLSRAMPPHVVRQWWMRVLVHVFAARHRVDVYLSPKGFVPMPLFFVVHKRLATVCVVHDLIPFWYFERLPGYFGFVEKLLVGGALKNSIAKASHIIAVSGSTRQSLLKHGAPPARVSVVPNGLPMESSFFDKIVPSRSGDEYIFGMASTLPHKNLRGVLETYRAYRASAGVKALPLSLCGVAAADVSEVGVSALGSVSNEKLIMLFRHASVFLFLPHIEGFGFPPLEALRHGTPVVCSKIPALEETCGPLATYVDGEDPAQCGAALLATLANRLSHDRAALAGAAVQRTEAIFSWSACADGVLDAARTACGRSCNSPPRRANT